MKSVVKFCQPLSLIWYCALALPEISKFTSINSILKSLGTELIAPGFIIEPIVGAVLSNPVNCVPLAQFPALLQKL